MFEGPVGSCGVIVDVVVVPFTKFGGGIRRLLDLPSEGLSVADDMLFAARGLNTKIALCYCGLHALGVIAV